MTIITHAHKKLEPIQKPHRKAYFQRLSRISQLNMLDWQVCCVILVSNLCLKQHSTSLGKFQQQSAGRAALRKTPRPRHLLQLAWRRCHAPVIHCHSRLKMNKKVANQTHSWRILEDLGGKSCWAFCTCFTQFATRDDSI